MKIFEKISEDIKIMEEDGKYFIKYRTRFLFFFKTWWYVVHETPFGLMYKPFYSIESAKKHADMYAKKYISDTTKYLHGL